MQTPKAMLTNTLTIWCDNIALAPEPYKIPIKVVCAPFDMLERKFDVIVKTQVRGDHCDISLSYKGSPPGVASTFEWRHEAEFAAQTAVNMIAVMIGDAAMKALYQSYGPDVAD